MVGTHRWAEHSGEAILQQSEECMAQAMAKLVALGFSPTDVKAVGITNQRETTLVWDRVTGKPLYNAIGSCCFQVVLIAKR